MASGGFSGRPTAWAEASTERATSPAPWRHHFPHHGVAEAHDIADERYRSLRECPRPRFPPAVPSQRPRLRLRPPHRGHVLRLPPAFSKTLAMGETNGRRMRWNGVNRKQPDNPGRRIPAGQQRAGPDQGPDRRRPKPRGPTATGRMPWKGQMNNNSRASRTTHKPRLILAGAVAPSILPAAGPRWILPPAAAAAALRTTNEGRQQSGHAAR